MYRKTAEEERSRRAGRLSGYGGVRIVGRSVSTFRELREDMEDPPVYRTGSRGPKTPSDLYFIIDDPRNPYRGLRIYFVEAPHGESS